MVGNETTPDLSHLCLVCLKPEKDKNGKWLRCLRCSGSAHSTCCRMAGVKAEPHEINWICDKCAYEIGNECTGGNAKSVRSEISEIKQDIIEMKRLLKNLPSSSELAPEVVADVSQAVRGVVESAVEACSGGNYADDKDTWAEVLTRGKKRKMKQQQKNLLIIESGDHEKATDKKEEVSQALDKVQILDTKFTSKGKIVMNFETEQTRKQAQDKLQGLGNLNISYGKKLYPKIMVCNVGKEERRETLIEHIIERNEYLDSVVGIKDKMKVIFEKPASGGTTHYIIKCDPEVRGLIYKAGDKVNLKWGRHHVYDRYLALMCYHCLKFGHKKDACPVKERGEAPTCFKCAGVHDGHSCRVNERKCANCRAAKRHDDHSISALNCPIFSAELMKIRNNTNHGY